jgi:4-hydroxy-3-polyprenylbenzoate decarboxylase
VFPYDDLWDFLADLEKEGEVKRVKAEINAKYELAAIYRVLAKVNGPALICENMSANVDVPMLTWMWGSWKRTAAVFGVTTRDEAIEKVVRTSDSEWIEPKMVHAGPCKEIIIKENEIDLWKQIPVIWGVEKERTAYITQDITISKDPETGIRNAGTYRHAFLDFTVDGKPYSEEDQRRCLASFVFPGFNHVGQHYTNMNGKPLEIAIAVGVDPTILAAAATPLPYGKDEIAFAGALRNKPVEMVKCETVDLEVPATSHFVIEAEVLPGYPEVSIEDGPFGEFYGYVHRGTTTACKTRVKCITRRKDALWPMVVEIHQPPHYEHALLLNIVETANLYSIRRWVPFISKIAVPVPPGNIHNGIAIVQIEKKPYPHFAHQVMRALWSIKCGYWLKYIIVVDNDVDPYEWGQIVVALQNRVQPGEDIVIYRNMPQIHAWDTSICGLPDPYPLLSSTTGQSQMGIDATVKVPERIEPRWDPRPRKSEPSEALVEKVYAKLKDELGLP